MPPKQKDSHPPQTLKQAKAAYRKADKGCRLTEKERRQIRREGELKDRADKIKEKEKQRLANKKKREAKAAKEKEAAQQRAKAGGGIDPHSRTKDGCARLESFFPKKRKREEIEADVADDAAADARRVEPVPVSDETDTESLPEDSRHAGDVLTRRQPVTAPNPCPRTPSPAASLRARTNSGVSISPAALRRLVADDSDSDGEQPRGPKRRRTGSAPSTPLASKAVEYAPAKPGYMSPPPPPLDPAATRPGVLAPRHPPPPPPAATRPGVLAPRHPNVMTPAPRKAPACLVEPSKSFLDEWEDAIASNSQIERELGLATPVRPIRRSPVPRRCSPAVQDPYDLPFVSTQDLELTVEDLEEINGCSGLRVTTPVPRRAEPAGNRRTITSEKVTPTKNRAGAPAAGVRYDPAHDKSPVESSYGSEGIDELLRQAFG